MMSQSPTNLPTVPPTLPGEIFSTPRRSVWPNIIGIAGIAFASFGLLNGILQLSSTFMISALKSSSDAAIKASAAGMEKHSGNFLIYCIFTLFISGVMLWLFIRITKRTPTRTLTVIMWAIGKIGVEAVALSLTLVMNKTNMNAMTQGGTITGPQAAIMSTCGSNIVSVGATIGFFFYCIFPVFCIIWFARRAIRTEMATWSNQRAA